MNKNLYSWFIKTIVLVAVIWSEAICQIPNAGFENWTNGMPDDWTVNSTPQFQTFTQSSDAHSGSSSIKGTVFTFNTISFSPVLATTFTYTQRPANLSGYYKFNSVGSDSLVIVFASYKNGIGIGGGTFATAASTNSYTQFNVPAIYLTGDTPDSVGILIEITPIISPHSGSDFYIDDLSFTSGPTAVNDKSNQTLGKFGLDQNYPNPFNPSTNIKYQIPLQSFVSIRVYNILGKKVSTLVNEEQHPGNYSINFNAADLPSGIYFCIMQAGNFYNVNKMILLK